MSKLSLLGFLHVLLTCNLLGCQDGVVYSTLEDALKAVCDGSSCVASCKCCLETEYAFAEACISSATPEWKPEDCKTHRNMGYCGSQYWNNQAGKCDSYNTTCGDR